MKLAYRKDIWRTIKNGKKRFIALVIITILGVTMYTGLRAACGDLRYTADTFFDEHKLFDINIVSTLGLTDSDVQALEALDEIKEAEGSYSESVYVQDEGNIREALIKTISAGGMNRPNLKEGTMPQNPDEIAVTGIYLTDTGKSIGDVVEIKEKEEEEEEDLLDEENEEEESSANFRHTTYTITAVVVDPTDVNSAEGAVGFRSNSAYDYTFFVCPEAVDSDVYTDVFLRVEGAEELLCYTKDYEDRIAAVVQTIEEKIKGQREKVRYDEIIEEANGKIQDAEIEMYEEFAEADEEFADARKELDDGWKEFRDGEKELEDNVRKAEEEIAKAWKEIDKGQGQLHGGWRQLNEAEEQLLQGEKQLKEGKEELSGTEADTLEQLDAAKQRMTESAGQIAETIAMLEAQESQMAAGFGMAWPADAWNAFVEAAEAAYLPVMRLELQLAALQEQLEKTEAGTDAYAALDEQMKALSAQKTEAEAAVEIQTEAALQMLMQSISWLDARTQQMVMRLGMGLGQARASKTALDEQIQLLDDQTVQAKEQFALAWKEIELREKELEEGRKQLAAGRDEIVSGSSKLEEGRQELIREEEKMRREIADARQKLADAKIKLVDGEVEYEENYIEYQDERRAAEEKIAEAKEEVKDIDMTKWYVQDRSSLSGYANVKSDAVAIEAIGTMFPILFLLVAVLISLTTITRMVEEERGLIGTYKALGFTDGEIRRKYLTYSSSACLLGGILGDVFGFVILPKLLFIIFGVMYEFPAYELHFNWFYGTTGIILFVVVITISAFFACQSGLRHMPAVLMRPKTPKSGSRVFLERMKGLWKRMSFLNKVTARNLFRYKKRLLMTIFGIMGCTALVLCGFTIQDSVNDLMVFQYDEVYQYDLMTVSADDDYDTVIEYLNTYEEVEQYQEVRIETVKLKNQQGATENVQLTVLPDDGSFTSYISFTAVDQEAVTLGKEDIFITKNASLVLDFEAGDTVYIQNLDLNQKEIQPTGIVENYLGNGIYMMQSRYEALFGEWKPNGTLAHLQGSEEEKLLFAQEFGQKEELLSCTSTQEMKEEFSVAFILIRMVVVIVLVMAAALAFTVLFTLATTNISERDRELATIKVLGFYDSEVHSYVNKETMILTGIGILAGIPVGKVFGAALMGSLEMSGILFKPTLHSSSYVVSVFIVLAFALLVNLITDRVLDRINPVEALKSVE